MFVSVWLRIRVAALMLSALCYSCVARTSVTESTPFFFPQNKSSDGIGNFVLISRGAHAPLLELKRFGDMMLTLGFGHWYRFKGEEEIDTIVQRIQDRLIEAGPFGTVLYLHNSHGTKVGNIQCSTSTGSMNFSPEELLRKISLGLEQKKHGLLIIYILSCYSGKFVTNFRELIAKKDPNFSQEVLQKFSGIVMISGTGERQESVYDPSTGLYYILENFKQTIAHFRNSSKLNDPPVSLKQLFSKFYEQSKLGIANHGRYYPILADYPEGIANEIMVTKTKDAEHRFSYSYEGNLPRYFYKQDGMFSKLQAKKESFECLEHISDYSKKLNIKVEARKHPRLNCYVLKLTPEPEHQLAEELESYLTGLTEVPGLEGFQCKMLDGGLVEHKERQLLSHPEFGPYYVIKKLKNKNTFEHCLNQHLNGKQKDYSYTECEQSLFARMSFSEAQELESSPCKNEIETTGAEGFCQ